MVWEFWKKACSIEFEIMLLISKHRSSLIIWFCMLCLILLIFLIQYINWWSDIHTSITHFWETFSEELARMWSSSVEMEYVIRVGSLLISVNENVWQNSLYLFTKAEMERLSLYDRFSFRMNFPFWSKLILKSPRR